MASLDEFRSQLNERFSGWAEESFEKGVEHGMERGIERGLAQGLAAQRMALRRQAALRFGVGADVLGPLLERVDAPDKLAEVGEWLMVDTLDQLIAKVEAEVADDRMH